MKTPPKRHMLYVLLFGPDALQLEAEVSEHLELGWQLHGHPFPATTNGEPKIFQAVILPPESQD